MHLGIQVRDKKNKEELLEINLYEGAAREYFITIRNIVAAR